MANTDRRWPYGFLDAFWSNHRINEGEVTSGMEITNDKELTGTVEYILAVSNLSDREKTIIRRRYQERKTYREIGKEFGITESTVLDIIHRAVSKLRRNSFYKNVLFCGVAAYARQNYEQRTTWEIDQRVDERVAQILQDERECRRRGLYFRRKSERKSNSHLTDSSRIAELDLSVRSYNALMHSGRKTISDILILKDRGSLLRIENIGGKNADEIIIALQRNGFDAKHLM